MTELLKAQGRLSAGDSKTVRVHAFDVPPGVTALALRFEYSPRKATDRRLQSRGNLSLRSVRRPGQKEHPN